MKHKVVPFYPIITDTGGAVQAAKELEKLIFTVSESGWQFVSLESMTTTIKPTGCASLGGKSETTLIQLAIFKK